MNIGGRGERLAVAIDAAEASVTLTASTAANMPCVPISRNVDGLETREERKQNVCAPTFLTT